MPRSYAQAPPSKYTEGNYVIAYTALAKNRERPILVSAVDDPARSALIDAVLARLKTPCAAG